ncbi:MAG TPA: hypothetical protein VFQ39_12055 [Longimicrobium sp.]|nr:hypothetical protein [Longimicrobium sp.]
MAGFLTSPWINVIAAVLGGLLLGFGIGRFAHEPSIVAAIATVFGVILLWWAVSDRRKYRPGTPESERDGSHTIE